MCMYVYAYCSGGSVFLHLNGPFSKTKDRWMSTYTGVWIDASSTLHIGFLESRHVNAILASISLHNSVSDREYCSFTQCFHRLWSAKPLLVVSSLVFFLSGSSFRQLPTVTMSQVSGCLLSWDNLSTFLTTLETTSLWNYFSVLAATNNLTDQDTSTAAREQSLALKGVKFVFCLLHIPTRVSKLSYSVSPTHISRPLCYMSRNATLIEIVSWNDFSLETIFPPPPAKRSLLLWSLFFTSLLQWCGCPNRSSNCVLHFCVKRLTFLRHPTCWTHKQVITFYRFHTSTCCRKTSNCVNLYSMFLMMSRPRCNPVLALISWIPSDFTANAQAFGLVDLLTLPHSFGSIYLGETFSSYISISNASPQDVSHVGIKAELQTQSKRITLLEVGGYSLAFLFMWWFSLG